MPNSLKELRLKNKNARKKTWLPLCRPFTPSTT